MLDPSRPLISIQAQRIRKSWDLGRRFELHQSIVQTTLATTRTTVLYSIGQRNRTTVGIFPLPLMDLLTHTRPRPIQCQRIEIWTCTKDLTAHESHFQPTPCVCVCVCFEEIYRNERHHPRLPELPWWPWNLGIHLKPQRLPKPGNR